MTGSTRSVVGVLLVIVSAPAFLLVAPALHGVGVVVAGTVALSALVAGIVLAGRWLGVFRRRREGPEKPQGCLPMFVTLLALLEAAAIVYYVVFYGAAASLGGWNV